MRVKQLIPILLWLVVGAIAGPRLLTNPPLPKYVNSVAKECNPAAKTCTTGNIDVKVGNMLVVYVSHSVTTTCPQSSDAITDSAGNTFSASLVCGANTNTGVMQFYSATVTHASASDTITASFPASYITNMQVRQYSGVSAVDVAATAKIGTASTATSNAFTTAVPAEAVIHCINAWSYGSSLSGTDTIGGFAASNFLASHPNVGCSDLITPTLTSATALRGTTSASGWTSMVLSLRSASPNLYVPKTTGITNAASATALTTYDGSGQNVHPSIVQFASPWHSYSYWLTSTPYPNADASKENPSIWASTDGATFVVPGGLTNPVSGTPGGAILHFDDPELIYEPVSDQLWLYYLATKTSTTDVIRRTSSDGVTWSGATTVFTANNYVTLSPAVAKVGSTYSMWYVNGTATGCNSTANTIEMRTSADGVNWSAPTTANWVLAGWTPWHLEVRWIPTRAEYWMVVAAHPDTQANCNPETNFFARSQDGINWITYPRKLIDKGSGSAWDNYQIYRSTFIYNAPTDLLRIWYSATQTNGAGAWNMGYVETPWSAWAAGR